jgi:hypothetical protein
MMEEMLTRKQSNIMVKPGYRDSALLSGANLSLPDKSAR